ncbi:MAG: hypothetical protein RL421_222 [Actinomycetota bacterium]|jgi:hypothetical protein
MALYKKEDGIRIAIELDINYLLIVSRRVSLDPDLVTASAPECSSLAIYCLLQGFSIDPGQHQDFF